MAARSHRAGVRGGRKPLADTDAGLLEALDALVEPETRGDPMTRLRWTTNSTRNLADELEREGHPVSHHSVGKLLAGPLGYSLQGNAKTWKAGSTPTATCSSATSTTRSPSGSSTASRSSAWMRRRRS
jgi:hypothetical protein